MQKKWSAVAAGILTMLVLGGLYVAGNSDPYRLRAKPRREWKDRAVAEIAHCSSDSAWVANEIATLKARATKEQSDCEGWLSPHLIVMTNGEWIAYASICSKENSNIHDIFVGRGSDGKWYYSTFHFCIGMLVLRTQDETEGQPGSLMKFAEDYYLREFDGQSDECLLRTWPPRRK